MLRDAPWMNCCLKFKGQQNNSLFKPHVKNEHDYQSLQFVLTQVLDIVTERMKSEYYLQLY